MTEAPQGSLAAMVAEGTLDLTGISTTLEPIGPGQFLIEVASCELRYGKQSGNPYLAYGLVVVDGEFAGRKLFFNSGLTENSAWSTKRTLQNLGFAEEDLDQQQQIEDICAAVVGAQGVAIVEVRPYQGVQRDSVKSIASVSDVGDMPDLG